MSYRKLFKRYLDDLSKKSSAPGGGSAASLVFSLGVSLMEMAVNFSINKAPGRRLNKYISFLKKMKTKVFSYIDLDADIFKQALKAKGKTRKDSLRRLNRITFDLGSSCIKILTYSADIRGLIKKGIVSDFDIGIKCVRVALFASVKNMEANSKFFGIKNDAKARYLKKYLKEI